jgi:large conductance mechanosensitive channel
MAVVDVAIVVPDRSYQSRRGVVLGEPEPAKTYPECPSNGLPTAARRCRHCGAEIGTPGAA